MSICFSNAYILNIFWHSLQSEIKLKFMNFNVNLLFLIYDKSNKSLDKVAK